MKILALDTSSKNASVAILEDNQILIELNNEDEKTHSQKLMPMIDEAFQKTKLSLNDISLIACGLGPGSFTGVRIGIATAKAFVDTKHIPCVGISSLEALAYNLNQDGYICSLINANHENCYVGFFHIEQKNGVLQTLESDFTFLDLSSPTALLEFLENNTKITLPNNSPIYFVGDVILLYEHFLQNLPFTKKQELILANTSSTAISSITLAKIGYTKYKNGDYGNSNVLSPIYLRKSQAELTLEQKQKT